ncbi:D-alanyl-D-alanine carboxypeptidase family protein [Notoacmeibacter sp. MSK16QG-6]|uniref:D-alanyl-D-alanine carboxypeptidase family protein n=1 Tax=Notoacmeibacter sp. MSK16QG-6 TaxID=2957982 RepID=UPI00209F6323|nr:D-alanyl-D-alanine carboxypeptidase family protein [Notoacmeibacter sp. MSK16QG-6]MCP1200744.1 D-alanyl-D-alanine carboxypeptidase [Notoacmeibacter sp. MSK16QG-6]
MIYRIFGGSVLALCLLSADRIVLAEPIETAAKQVLLLDEADGTVLLSSNIHQKVEPASLTKLMTAEVLLSELKAGRVLEDTIFTVSENAWRTGGAPSGSVAMFLKPKEEVPVIDLLRGIVVQSGNDAAITIAENLEGSEGKFAERMNRRAAELGLSDSSFRNASGLSDPEQVVSMADLVTLARHIHRTYPKYWPIFAEPAFEWNKVFQRNRNPALSPRIGGDGLKTGQNESLGFGVVATKAAGDRRVFLAMGGLTSRDERFQETRKLLDWALEDFARRPLYSAGDIVETVPVYGGTSETVALKLAKTFKPLIPIDGQGVTAQIEYSGPIAAPVVRGDEIARLVVRVNDRQTVSVPLLAAANVPSKGLFTRAADALGELAFGWLRNVKLPWTTAS